MRTLSTREHAVVAATGHSDHPQGMVSGGSTATSVGNAPTGTCATDFHETVAITVTVFVRVLATSTKRPSALAATPCGPRPVGMTATCRIVVVSTTEAVPPPLLATRRRLERGIPREQRRTHPHADGALERSGSGVETHHPSEERVSHVDLLPIGGQGHPVGCSATWNEDSVDHFSRPGIDKDDVPLLTHAT